MYETYFIVEEEYAYCNIYYFRFECTEELTNPKSLTWTVSPVRATIMTHTYANVHG